MLNGVKLIYIKQCYKELKYQKKIMLIVQLVLS